MDGLFRRCRDITVVTDALHHMGPGVVFIIKELTVTHHAPRDHLRHDSTAILTGGVTQRSADEVDIRTLQNFGQCIVSGCGLRGIRHQIDIAVKHAADFLFAEFPQRFFDDFCLLPDDIGNDIRGKFLKIDQIHFRFRQKQGIGTGGVICKTASIRQQNIVKTAVFLLPVAIEGINIGIFLFQPFAEIFLLQGGEITDIIPPAVRMLTAIAHTGVIAENMIAPLLFKIADRISQSLRPVLLPFFRTDRCTGNVFVFALWNVP